MTIGGDVVDRCACGNEIEQPATGRRREKCTTCRPVRVRNRRVAALPVEPAPTAPVRLPVRTSAADTLGEVEAATLAELEAAGREGTSSGCGALMLARLLDRGGYTAQGAVALDKGRRDALTVALAGAKVADDAVDELRRRRMAKAASA